MSLPGGYATGLRVLSRRPTLTSQTHPGGFSCILTSQAEGRPHTSYLIESSSDLLAAAASFRNEGFHKEE